MSDSPPPPPPPDLPPATPPDLPPPPPAIEVPPLPPAPSADDFPPAPPDLTLVQPPPFMPVPPSDFTDARGSQFATDRKGSNVLMYVGIGCGLLALIAIVAVVLGIGWGVRTVGGVVSEIQASPEKFAAEMIVKSNPDLELVTSDEATGEITFRTKSTGETTTITYAEAAKGNLKVTTTGAGGKEAITINAGQGSVSVESPKGTITTKLGTWKDAPAWFPVMDSLQLGGVEIRSDAEGGRTTVLHAVSNASTDEVVAFYSDELDKRGFTIARQSQAAGELSHELIEATDNVGHRFVTLNITRSAPGTKVVLVATIDAPAGP